MQSLLAAACTGVVMSPAPSEVIQRRKSPSEKDPVSMPCSSTQKTMPDLLSVIFVSAARTVSSPKTVKGVVWRLMIMG